MSFEILVEEDRASCRYEGVNFSVFSTRDEIQIVKRGTTGPTRRHKVTAVQQSLHRPHALLEEREEASLSPWLGRGGRG